MVSSFSILLGILSGWKALLDLLLTNPLFPPKLPSSITALDFQGKRVLVTGSNTGIGKETATFFAARGAEVFLLCRNEGKAMVARDEMRSETGNEKVFVEVVDMSSFESVRSFAKRWGAKGPEERQVDFLLNNAGTYVLAPKNMPMSYRRSLCRAGLSASCKTTTADGFEVTYQTNFLSQFLLTTLLFLSSSFSSNARIVQVSSQAAWLLVRQPLKPTTVNSPEVLGRLQEGDAIPWNTAFYIYGKSKAAQVLWTNELQARLARTEVWKDVVVQSCHPGTYEEQEGHRPGHPFAYNRKILNVACIGWVVTDIWKQPTGFGAYAALDTTINFINTIIGINPTQGAAVPIYVATSPHATDPLDARGQFWDRFGWRWLPGWMGSERIRLGMWRKWEEDSGVEAPF